MRSVSLPLPYTSILRFLPCCVYSVFVIVHVQYVLYQLRRWKMWGDYPYETCVAICFYRYAIISFTNQIDSLGTEPRTCYVKCGLLEYFAAVLCAKLYDTTQPSIVQTEKIADNDAGSLFNSQRNKLAYRAMEAHSKTTFEQKRARDCGCFGCLI